MFSTGFSSGDREGSRMMVNVFRDLELIGAVPPGAVHQDNAMGLCSDVAADLVEMHLHGARVGEGEHEGGALGPHGADGAEQVSVGVSLVGR